MKCSCQVLGIGSLRIHRQETWTRSWKTVCLLGAVSRIWTNLQLKAKTHSQQRGRNYLYVKLLLLYQTSQNVPAEDNILIPKVGYLVYLVHSYSISQAIYTYRARRHSPCGLYSSYATNAAKHFERAEYLFLCSISICLEMLSLVSVF